VNPLEFIDAAILEAEQIRARHDGVHVVHSCLCSLTLLRGFAEAGEWTKQADAVLTRTMEQIRRIDRTGFAVAPIRAA
jgi:hypothetical protein